MIPLKAEHVNKLMTDIPRQDSSPSQQRYNDVTREIQVRSTDLDTLLTGV